MNEEARGLEVEQEQEDTKTEPNFLTRMLFKMDGYFYSIGKFVGTHPWKTIGMTLLLYFIFAGIYFTMAVEESRAEELWVAQDTDSKRTTAWLRSVWPDSQPRASTILMTGLDLGDNVLNSDAMQIMLEIHESVANISVEEDDGVYTFESKCFTVNGACYEKTILNIWDQDADTILQLTNDEVITQVNTDSAWVDNGGKVFNQTDVIGGIMRNADGLIYHGDVLLVDYWITYEPVVKDGDSVDFAQESLEEEWYNVLKEYSDYYDLEFDILFFNQYYRSETFRKTITNDVQLLGIAYVIMFIYAGVMLGKRSTIRSGAFLGFFTVLSVALATFTAFGFAVLCGFVVTPLNNTLWFLLIGLGVDDAFVILQEYYRFKDEVTDVPELMGLTIRNAGSSIFTTSLTDFFVFALGATTVLPALSSFCFYAAWGVLMDFFFQITFFAAALVFHHRRTEKSRQDLYLCCMVKDEKDAKPEEDKCCFVCLPEERNVAKEVALTAANVITQKWFTGAIIIYVCVISGLSIYGLVDRDTDFSLEYFFDDQLTRFADVEEEYFATPLSIGYYTKDIDYFSHQADMEELREIILNSKYIDSDYSYTDWHHEYLQWAQINLGSEYINDDGYVNDENMYYDNLYTFLDGPGAQFSSHVIYDSDNGISAARIWTFMDGEYINGDLKVRYNAMEDVEDEVASIEMEIYPYNYVFVYWEEYAIIKSELARNLSIAIVTIIFIVMLLIKESWVACLTNFCIFFAILSIVGISYYWDVVFNGVSLIYTLIAVGLSVDYSIHVSHRYCHETGTSQERAINAVVNMGPAVYHGLFSTFLAVMCLITSGSYIFKIFFRMFFLTVIFGGFSGLVILPSMLATFGPDKLKKETAM